MRTNKVGRPQGRSPEQTRDKILRAARSCFVELGFSGATYKKIATKAGLTPAALYSYFSSKEHLYSETILFSYAPMIPSYKAALDSDLSFREKLYSVLMSAADFYEEDRELLAFFIEVPVELARHPKIMAFNAPAHKEVSDTFASIFQQAVEKGEVPEDLSTDDLLSVFVGGVMGIASYQISSGIGSFRSAVNALLKIIDSQI